MEALTEFSKSIIEQFGLLGIFSLTAAEQFIFPIPADIFISWGTAFGLPLFSVLIVVLIAAFVGSLIGYYLGKYLGHPIMVRLFGDKHINKAEAFINKWGIWGIIVAGLTPIPFKLITWSAGIFEMPLPKFLLGVLLGRMPRYILTAYAGVLIHEQAINHEQISAFVLGVVQGITEFLPISSSGHLVILEHYLRLPQMSPGTMLAFDILIHGASLLAILIYFRNEWINLFKELWQIASRKLHIRNTMTAFLIIGTIPAIIVGLSFGDFITENFRQIHFVALFFMLLSVFFIFTSVRKTKPHNTITSVKAILIGISQSFALIPGVSRAGMTIGTGILLGLKRETAAQFSFMLGGVAILAANVYSLLSFDPSTPLPPLDFTLIGFISAFVFSYLSIHYLIQFLKKHTLNAFAFYLMLMGILLLTFGY